MAKRKLNIPVKRGDRLELDVETLASSGDGLCRHSGYTLFTPGGLPGDRIRGKVIKTTPRFGVVDVFERMQLSNDRVDPPCPVFYKCGGCKFQDLSYEKQLEFKIQVVRDSINRIGGIELPKKLKPLLQSNNIITATKAVLLYREKQLIQKSDSIPKAHIMLPTPLFAIFF